MEKWCTTFGEQWNFESLFTFIPLVWRFIISHFFHQKLVLVHSQTHLSEIIIWSGRKCELGTRWNRNCKRRRPFDCYWEGEYNILLMFSKSMEFNSQTTFGSLKKIFQFLSLIEKKTLASSFGKWCVMLSPPQMRQLKIGFDYIIKSIPVHLRIGDMKFCSSMLF